jgi:HEPN domain-containing protein
VKRADFQKLAEVRIAEAEVLLKAKKFDGAYYLAGYAVECALKACVAKRTRRYDYPDREMVNKCYTHSLERLLDAVGLKPLLAVGAAGLQLNWAVVKDWNEQTRYERKSRVEAESLFDAITDAADGVLSWIKLHW